MLGRRLVLAVALLLAACASQAGPGVAERPPTDPVAAEAPRAAVASVVILEQKQCCACTQSRQRESRAVFDAALAELAEKPEVRVVYLDEDPAGAKPWRALREPVAAPAYYFLDGDGGLLAFLQGALGEAQVAEALVGP
ncbi:MAG: hypothetical protein JXB39_06825 [Deltaproteobacteria bacterium]|nr:hypothetical protein [Deltaproteobacteria bacterium]